MASVTLRVPDDLLIKLSSKGTAASETLSLEAAFSLCSRGELSTSQAARLAGLTYGDFLVAAARAKIELFPVNLEELKEEVRLGYSLGRQCISSDPSCSGGTP